MRSEPLYYEGDSPVVEPVGRAAGPVRRIGTRLLHEAREALPPTIFFFLGFNFIVLTSNLLVARYVIGLSNFMLATMAALVVGKAVLVANKIPLLRRYDRAPLIQPILFKTGFYWIIVFFVRFVHFLWEGNVPGDFGSYLITTFSCRRVNSVEATWEVKSEILLRRFLSLPRCSPFQGPHGPDRIGCRVAHCPRNRLIVKALYVLEVVGTRFGKAVEFPD